MVVKNLNLTKDLETRRKIDEDLKKKSYLIIIKYHRFTSNRKNPQLFRLTLCSYVVVVSVAFVGRMYNGCNLIKKIILPSNKKS